MGWYQTSIGCRSDAAVQVSPCSNVIRLLALIAVGTHPMPCQCLVFVSDRYWGRFVCMTRTLLLAILSIVHPSPNRGLVHTRVCPACAWLAIHAPLLLLLFLAVDGDVFVFEAKP